MNGKFPFLNRKLWLAIALATATVLLVVTPANRLFDRAFIAQLLECWGVWSYIAFVGLHIVFTVLSVPGTVMTLVGGAVFGIALGTILSVVGATLGAIAAFGLARYLCYDWIGDRFGNNPHLERFQIAVRCYPWRFVFAVRFVPISPFNVVNFLFGLTGIHPIPYSVGTLLGIIPGTLVYTWLGAAGTEALQGGDRVSFFVALSVLALLCVLPIFVRKPRRNSES